MPPVFIDRVCRLMGLLAVLFLLWPAGPVRAQATRGGGAGGAATRPAGGGLVNEPVGSRSLEGLPILRVEVQGNTQTPTQLILDQVRAQSGQAYSKAQAEVDVRSIASLDRFISVIAQVVPVANANRDLTGVVVRFVVEERTLVKSVQVVGSRKFTAEEIRQAMVTRPGTALDPFRIDTDKKMILDMYHKKGYAQTTVDVNTDATQTGNVKFQITEGPASEIMEIRFDGLTAFKPSYLKFKIQTKTNLWIFRKGLLDEDKLQQDLYVIQQEYRNKAYLDARVSYLLDYTEDKSKLIVRFEIIEGPRYTIGKINLTGNTVFAAHELLDPRFGPGSAAEHDKMEALRKRIIDTYGHEGYVYVNENTVQMDTSYTDAPGVVDLNITITEGKPFIVGRVIVVGNPNIQDRVIRRQIRVYPDQTFDMVQVNKSIERLKAERVYKDVKVNPVTPPGNPEGVRDALVEVTEGQTGKFSIGAGISTNAGVIGRLSIEQQNFDIMNWPHSLGEFMSGQSFKGAGQYYQLLLEPGTEFQRYRLRFEEPSLLDSPYSFGNDIYFFTRARESWDERRIGDIVTFGRHYGDVWLVSLSLRAEEVSITRPSDANNNRITDSNYFLIGPGGTPQGPFNDSAQEILNAEGSHFLASIKPGIVRDTTDSRAFPTTGTRSALTLEQYFEPTTFTKIVMSLDWYKTVYTDLFNRKTVFALRNEVGVIPTGQSPFYERFYLGGIGELRGFRFRGISPRSGPLNDPIGGDLSWLTTGELNFPIYEEILRGVVFVDLGTVESNITLGTIRSDFGAGVRITLPFLQGIPVALDFAYPSTKRSGDRTQIVSVSLGVPF